MKTTTNRLTVLVCLLLPLFSLSQQVTGVIHGSDGDKKYILPTANVYWQGTVVAAAADLDGKYSIEIPEGATNLIASFTGYQSDTIRYSGQSLINFTLLEGEVIESAEVEGHRKSSEMNLIDPGVIEVLTEKELCKAACCNLSESFETNAAIDASFTDAVTGTRQIRMLGLDGKFTQIMKDNIPAIRGLSTIYGLGYIPGAWINSIQISKGVGSVTNGYESITGQINVSHRSPDNADKLYINGYFNQAGRAELNAVYRGEVSKKWETSLLVHGRYADKRWDNNGDGFIDAPLNEDLIIRSEWRYKSKRVFGGYQATVSLHDQLSGQMGFRPGAEQPSALWGAQIATNRFNASAKTGIVFPEKEWKSIGTQFSFTHHDQESTFGMRDYTGLQTTATANILYQTRINSDKHKIVGGVSFLYDDYEETLDSAAWSRQEIVPGAFMEYTIHDLEKFTAVFGIRGDVHNEYGFFASPRMHARYSFTENASLKVGAGLGYRTPNVIMDHVGILASSREIVIRTPGIAINQFDSYNFQLPMEKAWNFGINYLHKFRLAFRDATFSTDFYHTRFVNQLILDLEDVRVAEFYSLDGESYSNSFQAEFRWSPLKRFDWRLAYRWLDVQQQFDEGMLSKPLVATHRGFTNLAYETKPGKKGGQWKFDATAQVVGEKRIPNTSGNEEAFQLKERSEVYTTLNAQVTRVFFDGLELYLGGENLLNYRQPDPIIAANDPYSENFDASLVWGPIFGRMFYAGFRWVIAYE